MDPTASSRRPPAGRTRGQPIIAERGDEPGTKPGESESSSGCSLPTKTPAQRNSAKPEAGCRSQRRAARGETGGNAKAAPDRTGPVSRTGSTQFCGARHRVDTAATTSTNQSDVARRYDAATAACNAPRRPGARQSGGDCHHGDTSTFKGTRRRGAKQACGAPRQGRTAALHGTRRPGGKRTSGARPHGATSAFSGTRRSSTGKPGARFQSRGAVVGPCRGGSRHSDG